MWPLWQGNLVNDLSLSWFVVLFPQPPTHFLESLTLLWPRAYWGHKAHEGICQRIYENFSNADNIKYSQGSNISQYTWSQWTRIHLFHLFISLVIRLRSQRGPAGSFSGSVSPPPNLSPEHIAVLDTYGHERLWTIQTITRFPVCHRFRLIFQPEGRRTERTDGQYSDYQHVRTLICSVWEEQHWSRTLIFNAWAKKKKTFKNLWDQNSPTFKLQTFKTV